MIMMQPEAVRTILEKAFPESEITVQDLTGGMDHFHIIVMSGSFRGKALLEQHRLVQAALQPALADGRIHAIQVKTMPLPV